MTDLPIELARHHREEADRVRKLAADAVLPGVSDALLSVVRQYAIWRKAWAIRLTIPGVRIPTEVAGHSGMMSPGIPI
jgi:hypothetical protein